MIFFIPRITTKPQLMTKEVNLWYLECSQITLLIKTQIKHHLLIRLGISTQKLFQWQITLEKLQVDQLVTKSILLVTKGLLETIIYSATATSIKRQIYLKLKRLTSKQEMDAKVQTIYRHGSTRQTVAFTKANETVHMSNIKDRL